MALEDLTGLTSGLLCTAVYAMWFHSSRVRMPSPLRSIAVNSAFVMEVVGAVAVTPGSTGAAKNWDSVGGIDWGKLADDAAL